MAHRDHQLKLRLPAELKARIMESANREGRSVNAEVVRRLAESFSASTDDALNSFVEMLAARVETVLRTKPGKK